MNYVSRETFRAVPTFDNRTVGWDDCQGQSVSRHVEKAYQDYSYGMDMAKKSAEAFDSVRKKIDANLQKPEPTLKSM